MFTIHEESPVELDKPDRISWPFKDMEIGNTLEIGKDEKEIFIKARVAAHAYSASNDKKFSTKIGSNGSLYIKRIS